RATMDTQEKPQPSGTEFNPIQLSHLWIRPVFEGKGRKVTGTLEAHVDGFRKNMINMDFSNFVNKVNDLWRQPQFRGMNLEFDQPLGASPMAWLLRCALKLRYIDQPLLFVPTSSCLVELIKTPFLVVALNEIEIQ
ncbi:hypothetical protein MKW94_002442, partial [Papaver nudicaule]|nr:hypothetical protein [Papaver nudicaule]